MSENRPGLVLVTLEGPDLWRRGVGKETLIVDGTVYQGMTKGERTGERTMDRLDAMSVTGHERGRGSGPVLSLSRRGVWSSKLVFTVPWLISVCCGLFQAGGCFGPGTQTKTLVSSAGGPQVLELVFDVGARPTELFVDGMRMTRSCRTVGRMMRCHVTGLSKRLHRIDVRMDGRSVVRCVTDGRAVTKCCQGCRQPPSARQR